MLTTFTFYECHAVKIYNLSDKKNIWVKGGGGGARCTCLGSVVDDFFKNSHADQKSI